MEIRSYIIFVRQLLKRVLNLSVLTLVTVSAVVILSNYSGACWHLDRHRGIDREKLQWFSDDEQIRMAVESTNKRGPTIQYRKGWGKMTDPKPIPYRDYHEFMKHNPNCCKTIGRSKQKSIPPVNLWTSILGLSADVVELRYTARFRRSDGSILLIPDFTEYAVVSNCGAVNIAWPEY